MSDAFEEANETQNIDYLAELKKKDDRFEDPSFMAKKVIHGDQHISKIEEENSQLRLQIEQSKTASNVLDEIKAELKNSNSQFTPSDENTTQNDEEKPDLAALVRHEMDTLKESTREQSNVDEALVQLEKAVGADNVSAAIAKKANEMGVSPEWLKDTAKKSSRAFMTFFKSDVSRSPSPISGGMNTETFMTANTGDAQKLEVRNAELRKTPRGKRDAAWHKEYMDVTALKLGL